MTIQSEFESWARTATPSLHVFSLTRTWDHPNGERYIDLATELAFQAYKARSLRAEETPNEHLHQMLEAVLAAGERVAMPIAHLALINDAGLKFIRSIPTNK